MTENQDKRLVREIRLANLLSFGSKTEALPLGNLNVLIGPNGAGKSNLIAALGLMRATSVSDQGASGGDVRGVIRSGGGTQEWIWKGAKGLSASVELVVNYPGGQQPLRHVFAFGGDAQGFQLNAERVENESACGGETAPDFYYRFAGGFPVAKIIGPGETDFTLHETDRKRLEIRLAMATFNRELSILAQRRDPQQYPEITYLADTYERWRIYREWSFGRNPVFREPQRADMRNDRLEEDFSNLGMFLSRLRKTPSAKRKIVEALRDLYAGITDFETIAEGGAVQLFFTEGDYSIPATRLSDGSLRYLCLLAILCDPEPPPLICIEEPELGLHPDILPKLADLLVAASQRTQLIVTTHSDLLVDAMTERPEAVVVCERHDGQTELRRLNQAELAKWLEKYRLGQLWLDGQLGGKRW
jgi:predicted ATPase